MSGPSCRAWRRAVSLWARRRQEELSKQPDTELKTPTSSAMTRFRQRKFILSTQHRYSLALTCKSRALSIAQRVHPLVRRIHLITLTRSQRQARKLQEMARRVKKQMQMTMTPDFMDLHDRELCFGGTGVVVTCDGGIDGHRRSRQGASPTAEKTRLEKAAPATPRTMASAMRRGFSREKQNRPTPRSTGAIHEEAPNLKDKTQQGRMRLSTAHTV